MAGKISVWPPGLDGRDLLADLRPVLADVAQRHVPVELVVEGEDAERLFVGHHVDGRLRRGLAEIDRDAGHAPGPIEHEDEGDFRLVAPLEGHRGEPLERRLPVAAFAEHRLAARDEQPASARFHPVGQGRHGRIRKRDARHVAQHDDVERVELRGRRRQARGRAHGHVEAGSGERARQVARACRRAFDVEHPGARRDPCLPVERVVDRERIGRHRHRRLEHVRAGRVDRPP